MVKLNMLSTNLEIKAGQFSKEDVNDMLQDFELL